jgi:hypothetical protein
MFVGHFALGFAAKRIAPRVSLAVLLGAAQLADVMWPVLVALGLEQVRIDPGNTAVTPLDFVSYPYSHSLVLLSVWGVLFALGYRWIRGNGRISIVLFALVVSHWVLDYVTHRPDMPIYPQGPRFGLGLWNSVPATLIVELAMLAAGAWIYARATRPRTTRGRWSYVVFVAFLVLLYIGNLAGPPPPSVTAIWMAGTAGAVLLLALSWWVDRQRDVYLQPDGVRAR